MEAETLICRAALAFGLLLQAEVGPELIMQFRCFQTWFCTSQSAECLGVNGPSGAMYHKACLTWTYMLNVACVDIWLHFYFVSVVWFCD